MKMSGKWDSLNKAGPNFAVLETISELFRPKSLKRKRCRLLERLAAFCPLLEILSGDFHWQRTAYLCSPRL
jgi:hypothetical protein